MLKLRCDKRNTYIERPAPPLVEEEAPFLNSICLEENKILGHRSRRDPKPGMAVLKRASSKVADRREDLLKRSKHRWEDVMKMKLKETTCKS
jgi:hypothetical protein